MGKYDQQRRKSEIKKACPGSGCCDKFTQWIKRNIVHFILVVAAIAAILGAILGSLDSCSDEIKNVTTTSTVVEVTPLASVVLIDGSGSMCYQTDAACTFSGCGCTAGTCPAVLANSCMSSQSCTCVGTGADDLGGDKWTPAKASIEDLNNVLNDAMNEGVNTAADGEKFQSGLIQWSSEDAGILKIEAPMSFGNVSTNQAAAVMNLTTGGTYWGTGLCQCYKMLQQNATDGANKMCVLLADGDLSTGVTPLGSTTGGCNAPDIAGRGSEGDCYCDYLWADASSAAGFTTSSATTSTEYVEEFVKYMNISILSVLVGNSPISNIYRASSCDGISEANADTCDYFFQLSTFDELKNKTQEIASKQRTNSTTTTTTSETVSSAVSVCSMDFLYALLAFVPFLCYLIYRTIDIKAKSKKMRGQLVQMIKSGDIAKSDMRRFAAIATNLLLPENYSSDIDWIIAYLLFQMPCMLPASTTEVEALLGQTTIAL